MKKFYHILLSLGIGALLAYIVANVCGFAGGDTEVCILFFVGFVMCILVYVLFYLRDIKKTLTAENQKLNEKIENLRKTVDDDARQSATNEDVHEVYVKICELQEQLNNSCEM